VSTPAQSLAQQPVTYAVEGYDLLLRLHQVVGDAYSVPAGAAYLDTIEQILINQGYLLYIIDRTSAAKLTPSARTWAFDESITWLSVVNDLLAAVGYMGIWSDWNGYLRATPYVLPVSRAPEWVYDDDPATTMLSTDRAVTRDFFNSPNKWVFYRSNLSDGDAPVEGNGIYTYVNQSTGDTSIDARDGLIITKPLAVDVADQASLVAAAQITISADMDIPTTIQVKTSPNPLHWHFDRLFIADADSPVPFGDVQCTSWTLALPPDTSDMQLSLSVISR
jgi:hypothetical protein